MTDSSLFPSHYDYYGSCRAHIPSLKSHKNLLPINHMSMSYRQWYCNGIFRRKIGNEIVAHKNPTKIYNNKHCLCFPLSLTCATHNKYLTISFVFLLFRKKKENSLLNITIEKAYRRLNKFSFLLKHALYRKIPKPQSIRLLKGIRGEKYLGNILKELYYLCEENLRKFYGGKSIVDCHINL